MLNTYAERVAALAFAQFNALPTKSKPRVHPNDTREWTPMSAVILASSAETPAEVLDCVCVATGTKCLPVSSVPKSRGTVLHDSHAEVLALRGLNRFLLSEIENCLRGNGYESRWVEPQQQRHHGADERGANAAKPFRIRTGVSIHLFSTEAPCGDASMGLLMQQQDDATAWAELAPLPPSSDADAHRLELHGRGYFSLLGRVRRKPSRADAEPTLSKSCTDKMAVRQATGLLGWPLSLFVARTENAYLKSMVLPGDRYDEEGFERAFGASGRLRGLGEGEGGGEAVLRNFDVEVLPGNAPRFTFDKVPSMPDGPATKAGNVSALWIRGVGPDGEMSINETLVNGVKQGSKQFSEKDFKMSSVCRKRMWEQGRKVVGMLRERWDAGVIVDIEKEALDALEAAVNATTYRQAKEGVLDSERRVAKTCATTVLGEWMRNEGDDDWGLD